MAPEHPGPLDEADLPLLMTLDQLRNPAPKNTNVRIGKKNKVSVDDPRHIKKFIQKGFDIAYPESKHTGEDTESRIRGLAATKAESDAWANPFKFDKAPVGGIAGKRDKRMEVALLHPRAPEERICQEHASKTALYEANPGVYPDPGPIPFDYELLLPEKHENAKKIRKSMNINDPDRDDDSLYTHEGPDGKKFHRYDRARTYATSMQSLNTEQKQRDIALTLFKPNEGETKQTAAYYYPILGKTRLKPERARTIAQAGLAPNATQTQEDQIDQMQVVVRDPDEAEVYKRSLHRANIDPKFASTLPPPPELPAEEQEEQPAAADEDAQMSDE
ncbi:uncharacterized protein N7477_008740 [Penicillium maclennaniae]|uniref:uncharacterized protein n=1 Tax=Penicillium maclennaniae TaxID=1343394 RepID=UPI00254161BD|nr:uncharacterized protein N7477_008740 [Penicillium maclennaniae]KAJ5666292.1 hypothetical protein N7477_008740 [Penicillium maclennaniae]